MEGRGRSQEEGRRGRRITSSEEGGGRGRNPGESLKGVLGKLGEHKGVLVF